MIYKRVTTEKIKMVELFSRLGVENKENAKISVPFPLGVNTPYGYKNIITVFRTEKQRAVTTYFKNNKTLKTSNDHLLKVNGDWKKVRDIVKSDIIETEVGTTSIKMQHIGKLEILYDISVEDVHCYYSNGIVSHNSWVLAHLGAEAMLQGKNVMHFTMELNAEYVGLRYDSIFSGVAFQDVRKNRPLVQKKVDEIKAKGCGKLFIKYFPTKTTSPASLKMHIERLQLITGVKIDFVVVDYADLLRPFMQDRNSNSYSIGGDIYGELRGVMGELQVPGWSASQSNRCLTLDTKVIVKRNNLHDMEDIIGNIKVGDQLLTHCGYKYVSRVFPIQTQPVYKICLKSGKTITCSANHEFPLKYGILRSISDGLSVGDKLFTKK
jgi:hypothetical protein